MSSRKKPFRKTPKVRKPVKERRPSENEIHLKCWQWVTMEHPGLLIFHVANERDAPVQYHVKLKRKGVVKGVADFLAFPVNNRKIAIELKDDKGVQDEDQIKFQKRWEQSGGVYFLVRTVEDFKNVIIIVAMFD